MHVGTAMKTDRSSIGYLLIMARNEAISTPVLCLADFNQSGKSRSPKMSEIEENFRLGHEKTDRMPSIQIVARNLSMQISHNMAVDFGVINRSTGKVLWYEFYNQSSFESISID